MTPEQEGKLNELVAFMASLKLGATIPLEVDAAFRDRLGVDFSASNKTAVSATQSVNEAGAATYGVAKAPSGFILIDGKNIPYYT